MAAVGQELGISFELTEEQKALRELAREFAAKEIRPREAEYDEHSTHPADVVAKAHELGLINFHIPEAYGGLGLSCFDGILVGEELCWGCSGIGNLITSNGFFAKPLLVLGNEEQQERWVAPLVGRRPPLGALASTEPLTL